MFGLQPLHIIVILVLALLIFGPARLPEIGRAFGRSIAEFRHSATSIQDEMRKGLEDTPEPKSSGGPEPKSSGPEPKSDTPSTNA